MTKRLGYDISGDDYEISGIGYFDHAGENDIAVAFSKKEVMASRARVVLTAPVLLPTSKTLIMTYDNLGMAIAKICDVLMGEGVIAGYRISQELRMDLAGFFVGACVHIARTAKIYPGAVIGDDVTIAEGCVVEPYAVIGAGTWMAEGVFVGAGSKIGAESFFHYKDETGALCHFTGTGRAIIGRGTHIGSHTIVQRGTLSDTVIGENCMIGNCVDIGHDVKIGNHCRIVSQAGVAGRAVLKDHVTVYGQAGISNNVVVGNRATVLAKALVSKSVEDGQTVFGIFGRSAKEELRMAAKVRRQFGQKGD